MRVKRIGALMLAAVMAFSLTACGGNASTESDSTATENSKEADASAAETPAPAEIGRAHV